MMITGMIEAHFSHDGGEGCKSDSRLFRQVTVGPARSPGRPGWRIYVPTVTKVYLKLLPILQVRVPSFMMLELQPTIKLDL